MNHSLPLITLSFIPLFPSSPPVPYWGLGHVYGTCIRGAWVTNMGHIAGLVYGTGRTCKWDRTDGVVAEGLDSGIGPVNGIELEG